MTTVPVAAIVDIVRSRELDDREAAQVAIGAAFDSASSAGRMLQPLRATVGDEFQAVFGNIADAVRVSTIVRLALPDGIDCRVGFGRGEMREIADRESTLIQDGPAWWRAREAIDEAHRRESKKSPSLRGWCVSDQADAELDRFVNSYLLLRDNVIGAMRARERRLAAGVMVGSAQADLARAEKITQSAVSQSLQRSGGAALLAAHQVLDTVEREGRERA